METSLTVQTVVCGQRGCKTIINTHGGWSNACCCFDCGKVYAKCEEHGGIAAARRSLKSHRGLAHPAKEAV